MSNELSNGWVLAIVSVLTILGFTPCANGNESGSTKCTRTVDYEETRYCMVSFYELIGHADRYDGQNIRLVGYIKNFPDGAVIGPNTDSIEGPLISENVVRIQFNDSLAEVYQSRSEKLSTIFGTFHSSEELNYFGILDPVDLVVDK